MLCSRASCQPSQMTLKSQSCKHAEARCSGSRYKQLQPGVLFTTCMHQLAGICHFHMSSSCIKCQGSHIYSLTACTAHLFGTVAQYSRQASSRCLSPSWTATEAELKTLLGLSVYSIWSTHICRSKSTCIGGSQKCLSKAAEACLLRPASKAVAYLMCTSSHQKWQHHAVWNLNQPAVHELNHCCKDWCADLA